MRTIKYTKQFKSDYKRLKKSGRHATLDKLIASAAKMLASDKPLPKRYFDHALSNNWKDHRDCHIKPDLVLIYRKENIKALEMVRLGSHSQLGL